MSGTKLDLSRTIRIGFAFLSICAFWQMYNSIIPLILTNTFHMEETYSGIIMAADNVLGLFLLPLFGGISDKCTSKLGRRKPFILFGTIAAVVLMMLLPFVDNRYFANPTFGKKALFIGILGALLLAMGTYRSPAVALMPDVTPKPLRSKGNAIINLMGAVGGILYLILASVLYSSKRTAGLEHVNYITLFAIVAGIMIVALIILMITVDEVSLMKEMEEYEAAHPEENISMDLADENASEENKKLVKDVQKSLSFLLLSVALWFIAYNGLETWFTTYANHEWGMSLGGASLCLTIATGGAILTYIPSGILAGKIGRRNTISCGIILMAVSFAIGFVYTLFMDTFNPALYALFLAIGMGWAFINVNSLPMVVEMCKGSDVGKFTGYYYTFSMSAQIVTPIVAGWLLSHVGYITLFPYACIFMIIAFITMRFVHHGDGNVEVKRGLDAFEEMD